MTERQIFTPPGIRYGMAVIRYEVQPGYPLFRYSLDGPPSIEDVVASLQPDTGVRITQVASAVADGTIEHGGIPWYDMAVAVMGRNMSEVMSLLKGAKAIAGAFWSAPKYQGRPSGELFTSIKAAEQDRTAAGLSPTDFPLRRVQESLLR